MFKGELDISDKNKIAVVITESDNKNQHEELKNSIDKLVVPNGFTIEVIFLPKDSSKAKIYNDFINRNTAKYKFYVDENVVFLQDNFLQETIQLFSDDEKIGVIGCCGTTQIPLSGIVYNSNSDKIFGKCLIGTPPNSFGTQNFEHNYKEVQCVFGGVIATQYDIQWREDLFEGDEFCDVSQCIEFSGRGYKCVAIGNKEPWIWNKQQDFLFQETDVQNFLKEYSTNIFPLVSIIIPTFNRPEFFKIALESVVNQTYQNLDILISDNSTDDRTEKLMQPYLARDKRIKYYHHKGFNGNDNWKFCLQYNNTDAEYVNWLMDDDVFALNKIELMVECYLNNPEVSLVFSNRLVINAKGEVTGQNLLSDKNFKMPGNDAGKLLLIDDNFIGEPTTVLIKKKYLRNNALGWTDFELNTFQSIDFSTWLLLLTQGDMFYFAEPLSSFRIHGDQASRKLSVQIDFALEHAHEVIYAYNNKIFLKTPSDFRKAAENTIKLAMRRLSVAYSTGYSGRNLAVLERYVRDIANMLMLISLNEE